MGKAREVNISAGRPASLETERAATDSWTGWQPLVGIGAISADVFTEILEGGQAFRWNRQADRTWLGVWAETLVQLRLDADERVEWRAPCPATATAAALARYFAVERDFSALTDTLPWRSDPHVAKCIVSFSGLRILRQPFGETLLGFLCSATKQIVQIKQMLALVAERHGTPLTKLSQPATIPVQKTFNPPPGTDVRRLPTWPELALVPESDLRACQLGFRARYIAETARFLAAHPGWLEETEVLPYAAAKERLCSLPGVGEKVADCVLLFGAGRLEAFPVDVWILKTLARRYGLDSWHTPQLAQFGRVHFGPLAGLAQQYLFAWERRQKKVDSEARKL